MMIPVTDPTLKASLILHMIEMIDRGDIANLIENGANPESLDQIRQLDVSGLLRLVHLGYPVIHFKMPDESVQIGLDTLNRQNEENDDLIYFIQHGASQSMLNTLFKVAPDVVQSYRKILSSERSAGRTSLPPDKAREEIQNHWYGMGKEPSDPASIRKQLRQLHARFNHFSIDVLYATINEFNDVIGRRRS